MAIFEQSKSYAIHFEANMHIRLIYFRAREPLCIIPLTAR